MDCGTPGKLNYGKVTLASNATYYGALALYACDANYELDGVSRRLCLENGTWSSDLPVCRGMPNYKTLLYLDVNCCIFIEIQCKDPDSFEGVSFKVSTHSVGGIAQYACPRGHHMHGNETRTCLERGTWSGKAPTCTGKSKYHSKCISA